MFQCCLSVNWINFNVYLQLRFSFLALANVMSQNHLNAAIWEKKKFQFDECYLVKGRASNNDATKSNTENETFPN